MHDDAPHHIGDAERSLHAQRELALYFLLRGERKREQQERSRCPDEGTAQRVRRSWMIDRCTRSSSHASSPPFAEADPPFADTSPTTFPPASCSPGRGPTHCGPRELLRRSCADSP